MSEKSDNEREEAIVPSEKMSLEDAGAGDDKRWHQNVTFVLSHSSLLTGLCRLVPIPFLDDYLERQSRRYLVHTLINREGRSYSSSRLSPLYEEESGSFLAGCFWWCITLPWTLTVKLLKKIFKKIFFVFAVHEAAMSMGETLLLGHCLHRRLLAGAFAGGSGNDALRDEALEFKAAFDVTYKGSDRRLLRQLMATVFSQVKALPKVGTHAVRAMFGRGKTKGDEPGAVPEADKPTLSKAVEELQQAMQKAEVKQFLADFETRFEQALKKQKNAH